MMDHLDDGTIQALLDGELDQSEAYAAREHIGECVACGTDYGAMRDSALGLTAALSHLDEPTPRRVVLSPPSTAVRQRPRRSLALPRAAVLLLGFAAAASATIPGSPVRGWIESRLASPEPRVAMREGEPASTAPVMSATDPADERGVGVAPAGGRLRVVVTGAAPGLRVRAVLTESSSGGAYAIGDAEGTRFSGRGGVVEVFDAAGEELRVEIPRTAAVASLEIDGRTYVAKDGAQLRLFTGAADRVASELVFFIDQ